MTVPAEFLPHFSLRLATVRAHVVARIQAIAAVLKDFAPYAAVELILPGGSVLALLLWLYRRHQKSDLAICVGHACRRGFVPIPIGSGKDRSNAESFSCNSQRTVAVLEAVSALAALADPQLRRVGSLAAGVHR